MYALQEVNTYKGKLRTVAFFAGCDVLICPPIPPRSDWAHLYILNRDVRRSAYTASSGLQDFPSCCLRIQEMSCLDYYSPS